MKRSRHLFAWRCARAHVFLQQLDACPECGGALSPTRVDARARLLSCTTVRVNPDGVPYRLGVARTKAGATTLCVVVGRVRGLGRDPVRLEWLDGRFVARGARARVGALG